MTIKFCYLDLSVLKILKHIFNITIWVIIGLYLLLMIIVNIPAVQESIGRHASRFLARQLGTEVSIERVDIGFFNRLTLDHVLIRDQSGYDMLTARRLSATVDILPLLEGKISISSAQIFGTHAKLYQADAQSKPNFQFVIDSLASRDTVSSSPLDLRINSLIIRHSSVSYDRLDMPKTPERLNPNHLKVTDISAHILLKVLKEDSVNVNVKRLAFNEQSGLKLNRLSLKYEGGRHYSLLKDFQVRLPGSHLELGDLEASYRFRDDHFVMPSLKYTGSIKPSEITLSDLHCLVPSLKNFKSTLSLQADFKGHGDDLKVTTLEVGSNTGDVSMNVSGWLQQLSQHDPIWTADINDLNLSAHTISFISENIKGEKVNVPDELIRLGDIHMKGFVSGTGLKTIRTKNHLMTTAGDASLSFSLDEQRKFTGSLSTANLNLKRLLNDEKFGNFAADIDVNGQLAQQGPSMTAKGNISKFDYLGYQYKNINLNGNYSPNDISGKLTVNDPNLGLDIEGQVKPEGKSHNVNVTATLLNFSPQATNLSNKWADARFFGELTAKFQANNMNDAVGSLTLHDFYMLSPTSNYELDELHIESGYNDETHYMTLHSDFGEAEVTGNFDYETLVKSLTNILATHLPTLPGLPQVSPATDNDFTISATINKSDWLQKIVQVPLHLNKPLSLHVMINDRMSAVDIECRMPQFHYNSSGYENGVIRLSSPNDSLRYDVSITKVSENGNNMQLRTQGTAHANQLINSFSWDNHAYERMSGQLNAIVDFETSFDNKATANIHIQPSMMIVNNAEWQVKPCFMSYTAKRLGISGFEINHGQQYLKVSGLATDNNQDSLSVNLQDVDIEYVLNLVDFDAVSFKGQATGQAVLSGIFGNLQAGGHLVVNDFLFEDGRMGMLDADVNWNERLEQIDIQAVCNDGADVETIISGYVTPKRDSINLGIEARGTYLDFARSFTSSFLDQVDGHAEGAVRLIGPLDAINLTGQLVINGKVHVTSTNCYYEMRNDTLKIVPNEIEFAHCPIYDKNGREGILTGGIHHENLTNLTYDIYADTENLLAYDFKDFGDDTFYGTVYANGHVGIHGRDDNVYIDIDVTPLEGTTFVYNVASPDAIASQEFVEWGKPTPTTHQPSPNDNEGDDFRSDLNLHMKINCTPQATVRLLMDARTNDYITLHGTGEIQANFYNKGGFTMIGTYRVIDGTYGITIQEIIKKNFVFLEGGTVVFSGDPYDAALNLQAQHTVNGVSLSDLNVGRSFSNTVRVNCLMNITGQPRAPQVDFDLDIPNVNTDEKQMVRAVINSEDEMNQQVIYLLAVGRFYPQQANNAENEEQQGPSKTSLAMQSLLSGTISGQINSMLGRIIKSNNWDFGANISTGDEGWNNAEYEGLVSGRMLNNRLLINGQFGYRDNVNTATSSFIGDFDIRYLLLPNGNLALKVYNQTNDRYFTKSSLNTQGIGIIMKKDFNGFNDLFDIRKRKKEEKEKNEK